MADGGRVGKFPHEIIGDQRLPLRVVLDECLEMSLQEIGGGRHKRMLWWFFLRLRFCVSIFIERECRL